ncbi:phosphotransferase [Phocaeicola coprocola]|jgi:aminoglycoside/choline kinase family phosphotransferase|uniref:Phosphotransferase n=1 Tax=Phocaeicola coprocola TaxID=310298 RepID=A0A412GLY1_9BACT|nr:RNase adapter RapZ [Phocaeicola coprocola]RGR95796.1 phosphotransferase [Phocaeicola coprocola]
MNTELLAQLYQSYTGEAPTSIEPLPGAGSNRKYFRLKGKESLIGVYGTSTEENRAFIYMARHFSQKGLPVPRILAEAPDQSAYLQDDLGDTSLFQLIKQGRESGNFSDEETNILKRTIRLLPQIQFEGSKDMDFSYCYPLATFNRRSILWDLNYFKYCFLKATGLEFQENLLEDDFERMADTLLQIEPQVFMYRDFQSRNIMIREEKPYFIDFQGGRKGPFYYDVASFLWQAKANYPDSLRQELLDEYLDALRPYHAIDKEQFLTTLRHFVLFRTLQVLGAYGFRGYFEKKAHFIQSVPYAIENLRQLLETDFPEYPYLCLMLRKLTELPQFASIRNRRKLTVRVMSFSYKKGIPEDPSGNGGGYVFDCRAVHNPGKYEQYKQLTGRDKPVIDFLEQDGEILQFLEHVDALADAHVQRFLERGFTNLSICFGCTGGQHRSVYSAEHVAHHLNEKFGVRIRLIHREQHIEQILEPR